MVKLREHGSINVLLIPLILMVLFFIGAGVFGYWAFSGRQDYKDNVDQKISVASAAAVQKEDTKKDAEFAEEAKNPLKIYSGPSAYGGMKVSFPKTWSGYVNEDPNGATDIDAYFYPGVVPDTQGKASAFALRIQILTQPYSSVIQNFTPYVTAKKVTSVPYSLPKVPSVIGVRLDGEVIQNKQGSMVILPLRDTTLEIWTEATQFVPDFNTNILPNFTFSP